MTYMTYEAKLSKTQKISLISTVQYYSNTIRKIQEFATNMRQIGNVIKFD